MSWHGVALTIVPHLDPPADEHFVFGEGRHHCVAGPHIIHIFSFSKVCCLFHNLRAAGVLLRRPVLWCCHGRCSTRQAPAVQARGMRHAAARLPRRSVAASPRGAISFALQAYGMMGWRQGYIAYPEDGSGALAAQVGRGALFTCCGSMRHIRTRQLAGCTQVAHSVCLPVPSHLLCPAAAAQGAGHDTGVPHTDQVPRAAGDEGVGSREGGMRMLAQALEDAWAPARTCMVAAGWLGAGLAC